MSCNSIQQYKLCLKEANIQSHLEMYFISQWWTKLYFRQGQEWQSRKAVRAHMGSNIHWQALWTLHQSMAELLCVSHSEFALTISRTVYINWATCTSATAPEPTEEVSLDSSFNCCCSDLCGSHWQVMVGHRQDLLPFSDHLDVLETFLLHFLSY